MTYLVLEKARKSPRLVPEKRTITRNGSTFQMTVWVDPKANDGPWQGGLDFDAPEPKLVIKVGNHEKKLSIGEYIKNAPKDTAENLKKWYNDGIRMFPGQQYIIADEHNTILRQVIRPKLKSERNMQKRAEKEGQYKNLLDSGKIVQLDDGHYKDVKTGFMIPAEGDSVFKKISGFGGGEAIVGGIVYRDSAGDLMVKISNVSGGVAGKQKTVLDGTWRVKNDPRLKEIEEEKNAIQAKLSDSIKQENIDIAEKEALAKEKYGVFPDDDQPEGTRVVNADGKPGSIKGGDVVYDDGEYAGGFSAEWFYPEPGKKSTKLVVSVEKKPKNKYPATIDGAAELLGVKIDDPEKKKSVTKARISLLGHKTVCPRCGGSGSFSYNLMDGSRCYGCNGTGNVSTKITPELIAKLQDDVESGKLDRELEKFREQKALEKKASGAVKRVLDTWHEAKAGRDYSADWQDAKENPATPFNARMNSAYEKVKAEANHLEELRAALNPRKDGKFHVYRIVNNKKPEPIGTYDTNEPVRKMIEEQVRIVNDTEASAIAEIKQADQEYQESLNPKPETKKGTKRRVESDIRAEHSDASLDRQRKSKVIFKKPYTGKTGAQLLGYEWPHIKVDGSDKWGNDKVFKYSNWDEAEINEMTGRNIVHKFVVKMNGEIKVLSAESAAEALGVSTSTARNQARKLLEQEIRHQKAEDEFRANVAKIDNDKWYSSPAEAVDNIKNFRDSWIKHKDWGKTDAESLARNGFLDFSHGQEILHIIRGPKGYQFGWLPMHRDSDEHFRNLGWSEYKMRAYEIWDKNGEPRK